MERSFGSDKAFPELFLAILRS